MSTHAERQSGPLDNDPPPAFIDVMNPARESHQSKVDPLAFEKLVLRALETMEKKVDRQEILLRYLENTFGSIPTVEYQGESPKTLKERMQYNYVHNSFPTVKDDIGLLRELLGVGQGTQIVVTRP